MSVELPRSVKLGKGALLLHPYSITFNTTCVIGDNVTILKGATIGESKTGKIGSPIIGNNVYIGLNSTVVGNIHIGNDVMIAPNTFVNFDVPDGALVLGSPGVIHEKEKASKLYISNSILDINL
ncbi:MAG: serine acetyltransferase [Prevotella sp.]|nr:serine acetyltransferase [Prevotella sp.]